MESHLYGHDGRTVFGMPYRFTFYVWQRLPQPVRTLLSKNTLTKDAKKVCRNVLARFAGRDDYYNKDYYLFVDAAASSSAPTIVDSVLSTFAPRRLLDVGCGTGALLAAFQSKGISCVGLEYSLAALETCAQRGLEAYRFNIEEGDQRLNLGKFDLVTCVEVAEHLSAECADSLVDLLVRFADRVMFTAATPGQGGYDHVNEQPHEYWIAKFDKRGYRMLTEIAGQWRREWEENDVAGFYFRNIMVFEKRPV